MHQTMFPLLTVNTLENHATKERPLSVTEITEFVNREFGPLAVGKEQLMNRSTMMQILDAMEFWIEEGNLLNSKVTQCGSENKKLFCLERPKGWSRVPDRFQVVNDETFDKTVEGPTTVISKIGLRTS